MKRALVAIISLFVLAAIVEGIVLARMPMDPRKLGGVLAACALILGAFVGLAEAQVIRQLRQWTVHSVAAALALPFALLVPYAVYVLGTGAFSLRGFAKLAVYIAVPTALLIPDRLHHRERASWRDFAAIVAMGLPVGAGWMSGLWTWPLELYFFLPLTAICVGVYAFVVLRSLDGVGYKLTWRKGDVLHGLANFVAFTLLGIPLGYALHFIRFHPHEVSIWALLGDFVGIYLTIAIPEELLFRGILQNLLTKSLDGGERGARGLLIASVVFGLSHLHHAPVPNWRYAIMATLAGIFYGNAYRSRHRISSSALTHALVDTLWHFWF